MAEHRTYRPSGRRSPTFNPARASMPLSVGYSSMYGGDIHAIPTARYDSSAPRQSGRSAAPAPNTTITTYNVTKDPLTRSSSVRDSSRPRHRSSTIDSTATIKPIIVTTRQAPRSDAPSSHTSSTARTTSPSRDPYRSSDEAYYAQPASSIRSRSHQRHYSQGGGTADNDEFYRLRERTGGDDRNRNARAGGDQYRLARPQSLYVQAPRGASAVDEYANDGYEYTKPSDLARYDLDNDRNHRSRRESFDRNYSRPSVNVVSNDPARYEARGRGPPPTSAGLERYNRAAAAGIYDRPSVIMPAPPAVPAPPQIDPPRRSSGLLDAPASPIAERRSSRARPVSLYQESTPRMSQADDVYRPRDDERAHRDRRDRDDVYHDESGPLRAFGIRTDTDTGELRRPSESDRRLRREPDDREPKRRSDEELDRARRREDRKGSDDKDRASRVDDIKDRKDSKDGGRGEKVRDKVAAGFGAAAAAIGLGAAAKGKEDDKADKVSPKRRGSDEEKESRVPRLDEKLPPRAVDVVDRKPSPREDPIVVEHRPGRSDIKKDRVDPRDQSESRERTKDRDRERDRNRREAEAKLSGSGKESRDDSPLHSDDSADKPRRRHRPSSAFNPTDTSQLMDLRAQLAAKENEEKAKEKPATKPTIIDNETAVSSGSEKQVLVNRDESRGREAVIIPAEEKQVRLVSPPRDKGDQKPIKGILKAPSTKFPEDKNHIREGVAPHKDDKTKKDVPPGARWTKISRKMVNPEALTIGKERFEVRDDFVIVLRVLSKEEIQGYAIATAQLREMRRKEFERDNDDKEKGREKDRGDRDHDRDRERERERERERDRDRDRERDREREREREREEEERRRRHRHREEEERREKDRDYRDREPDREYERQRRHKRGSDSEDESTRFKSVDYQAPSHHHHHHHHHRDTSAIGDDRR